MNLYSYRHYLLSEIEICEKLWVQTLYQKTFKCFVGKEIGSNAERLHPLKTTSTTIIFIWFSFGPFCVSLAHLRPQLKWIV